MLPGRMKRMKDNMAKVKDGGPGSGIKGHTTAEEASEARRTRGQSEQKPTSFSSSEPEHIHNKLSEAAKFFEGNENHWIKRLPEVMKNSTITKTSKKGVSKIVVQGGGLLFYPLKKY